MGTSGPSLLPGVCVSASQELALINPLLIRLKYLQLVIYMKLMETSS